MSTKPRKVLVTGGSGFIGSYVVERLLSQGSSVLLMDRAFDPHSPLVTREGVEVFLGDVRDATAVTEAVAHVDGVIHLAAVLGTQETIYNHRPAAETNIFGSLNILEAANQYNIPVVYAGVGNHWMREYGAGTYTITKTAIEDFIRMYNQFRGGRISVVRPVNAYGPGQSVAEPFGISKVRKIIPSFVCRALTGEPVEVYGDGTQISDCVYVVDVAESFVSALNALAQGQEPGTFEVGPSVSVTVETVARMVIDSVNLHTTIRTPSKIQFLPMRPGEVPNSVTSADSSSLELIGVDTSKFTSLRDGLELTVKWYHQNWLPEYQAFR